MYINRSQIFVNNIKSAVIKYETKILFIEEVPEVYWKDLAEERRKALDESLHENEMVTDSERVTEKFF